MEKMQIEVLKATMGYRRRSSVLPVLEGISFSCGAGELIGVAGVNGAGKSTLLRSLCGLIPLLDGEVLINGEKLSAMQPLLVARKISVVLTGRAGGFNLSAWDAVAAGQMPYTNAFHRLERAHREVIEKAMDMTGVSGYRQRPLGELSDGLYQKTMIARALAQQTPVMLLDEPNAFLDYASRHELYRLLRLLCAEQGKCILLSTHDLDLILKYCTKVLVVAGGRAELTSVADAANHPAFLEIGGGYL